MKTDKNMTYVGTLQELGRPYSMLFVDTENRQLYIFVRASDGANNTFLVSSVSPKEVESYMNERTGLLNLLSDKPYDIATLNNGEIAFQKYDIPTLFPTDKMKRMNMFDPELCDDDVWLEVFLNRINKNQPLEIS